jgi:lysophospholipase L1-like esterase
MTSSQSYKTGWAKVIATGIISLVILLILVALIEGAVRWLYPEIPPQFSDRRLFDGHKYGRTYGYKSLASGEELGALVMTDEHGFRTSARSRQRIISEEQILVLGDSVSVGVGVEAEQTYPSLLEDKLGKRVLNASVTGYGIVDYAEVLGHIAGNFKPQLVIVGICLNDVSPTSQANIVTLTRTRKEDVEVSPDERRYPTLLMRTLRYINDNYLNFHSARDHFEADRLYYRDAEIIEFLSSQFAKLKRSLTDEKVLLFVLFPYEYQLRIGSLEILEPQNIIKEAGRRAGVTIYDPYEELSEYLKVKKVPSRAIYLFNDPLHFNSVGHHALADLVYRHINQRQISP